MVVMGAPASSFASSCLQNWALQPGKLERELHPAARDTVESLSSGAHPKAPPTPAIPCGWRGPGLARCSAKGKAKVPLPEPNPQPAQFVLPMLQSSWILFPPN